MFLAMQVAFTGFRFRDMHRHTILLRLLLLLLLPLLLPVLLLPLRYTDARRVFFQVCS